MATPRKFWSDKKRFRLMLTLELAVMLPAAALIYVNFHQLESVAHDKTVEATIHRDFQYVLSVSEKKMNDKIFTMAEETRDGFPNPDIDDDSAKAEKLDALLAARPWLAHAFVYDSACGIVLRSQPLEMSDPGFCAEHSRMAETYKGWFGMEGRMLREGMLKKSRPINCYVEHVKRSGTPAFMATAFFPLTPSSGGRVVLAGVSFDPEYLEQTFFPQMIEELVAQKVSDDGQGNQLALIVYPTDDDINPKDHMIAASAGWGDGKPEVTRNLDEAFRGLALGIKFQGTTVEAIGRHWLIQGFIILGVLTILMIAGLVLTYRSVAKEMSLARLKSDFVSNVSHELRTPLSLIQLYSETLELGRIDTQERKQEYYTIIRKESERLGRLINNILDFSRIEAGRKEYELRDTDIAELVSSTLDAYRYQIERQGFELETHIEPSIPAVRVDREAIGRAVLNLINNALKYSVDDKFLGVNLYRAQDVVKLEVVDHGIGIERREQSKIFEEFYRTCDPLVHTTKGSGLGLSLVRHITQAHGGRVDVDSAPGKGSTFTLSLPLDGGGAAFGGAES